MGGNLVYKWQRLCWFTEGLTLSILDSEYNGWEIQKKKMGKLLGLIALKRGIAQGKNLLH
jgi:hypothetical protein